MIGGHEMPKAFLITQLLPAAAAMGGGFVEGLTGFGSAIVVLLVGQLIFVSAELGLWNVVETLPSAFLDYDFWIVAITVCQVSVLH